MSTPGTANFASWGITGYPFFIISGYCIRMAQQHAKTPNEYMVRRLFRILPPFWFSLIFVAVSVLALKLITGTNSVVVLPKSIQQITAIIFLYTIPASHFQTVNWVYWTLSFELVFYIIIYISMLLPTKSKLIFPLLLTIIALIIPGQDQNLLFVFNELPTFMLGYSLYLIIHKTENTWLSWLLLILAIAGHIIKHPAFNDILIAAVVCSLIIIDSIKPLKNNIFSKLGDYSYSLYLIHVPIGCWLFGFVINMKAVQNNVSLNIIADFAILAIALLAAWLMFYYVELPSIKLGKTFPHIFKKRANAKM